MTGETGDNGKRNAKIMEQLNYLDNFWITLEMPLINYEINLALNMPKNCVIVATVEADQGTTFSITDIKI